HRADVAGHGRRAAAGALRRRSGEQRERGGKGIGNGDHGRGLRAVVVYGQRGVVRLSDAGGRWRSRLCDAHIGRAGGGGRAAVARVVGVIRDVRIELSSRGRGAVIKRADRVDGGRHGDRSVGAGGEAGDGAGERRGAAGAADVGDGQVGRRV